jgi:UDP-N-acetylmuramoyl-L-alanyl-D-glutamate--2,6-diaminopimelate ligase
MKLADILIAEPQAVVKGDRNREIAALRYDSRQVQARDVFFAWKGQNCDGHEFIAQACDRGAAAIVLEDARFSGSGAQTYVEVPNSRKALARMAAAYYGRPDQKMSMVGVTGTNGKTTTAFLVKHLLEAHGRKTGLVGTIRVEIGERMLPIKRTTPEGLDLHEFLAMMHDAGCTAAVMEVTSHALEQGRVLPIQYQVGVFTNLTQDHLDYHGSMENYFEAKRLLFTNLDRENNPGVAVLNADDMWSAKINRALSAKVRRITYSASGDANATLSATELKYSTSGTNGKIRIEDKEYALELPLIGSFNAANALAAAGAALALGMAPEAIVKALTTCPQVPGRLEKQVSPDGVTAVVDYAHTDDAVIKALQVLRGLKPKKLIVVLGCGGNRDATKRPKMARAAVENADFAVFTADNPRNEKIEAILADMTAGVANATNFVCEPDRRKAIELAIQKAGKGDVVCVAGKGHETTQEIAGKFFPFDDRIVVNEIFEGRNG